MLAWTEYCVPTCCPAEAMAEVIRNTTSQLTTEDLSAMIAYLRALPHLGVSTDDPQGVLEWTVTAGGEIDRRRSGAAIGHMHHLGASQVIEKFAGEVLQRVAA
mgnify:CR=1 FL=1